MSLIIDSERGRKVANLLYNSFLTVGIHGRTEMPEDLTPTGIIKGSIQHTLFITLTVSIDYQRDAPALWESSRRTFEDPETRYLFDPKSLYESPSRRVVNDMQKYRLSQKPTKDAHIWQTVGVSFYKKWDGNPCNFLENHNWDSLIISEHLKNDTHFHGNLWVSDYPYLRGPKIGPFWLRMLRDNVGISQLTNLGRVPIPVDRHIARATLTMGVVRGTGKCTLDELFGYVRKAWFQSVRGLRVKYRPMISLDVDEPLWHLSKYGCTSRDMMTGYCPAYSRCEARDYCINGTIKIVKGIAEVKT